MFTFFLFFLRCHVCIFLWCPYQNMIIPVKISEKRSQMWSIVSYRDKISRWDQMKICFAVVWFFSWETEHSDSCLKLCSDDAQSPKFVIVQYSFLHILMKLWLLMWSGDICEKCLFTCDKDTFTCLSLCLSKQDKRLWSCRIEQKKC